MKAKLLVLLTFLFLFMDASAVSYALKERVVLKSRVPGQRSSFPLSTTAVIDGSLLFIDFSSPVENVTTVITDTETGELIYSSTYTSIEEITIDLNAGKYTLEILLDTTTLFGDFCI